MDPTPRPESLLHSRLDAIATRWSLIHQAHVAGTPQNATVARQALVLRYAKSVRRYIGGIVRNTEDADELAQDAIMRLMKGDFAGADPNRGRFRDLLKTAVRNMVHSHWTKANRRRPADVELDSVVGTEDHHDPLWDAEFQSNVLDHAWAALREFERKTPKRFLVGLGLLGRLLAERQRGHAEGNEHDDGPRGRCGDSNDLLQS